MNVEEIVIRVAAWTVPVNVLIWLAGKDYDTQRFRRSWLPPEIASRVEKIKGRKVKGDNTCQKK
jgi:hypothetical protein